jgi:hypothetical protein
VVKVRDLLRGLLPALRRVPGPGIGDIPRRRREAGTGDEGVGTATA